MPRGKPTSKIGAGELAAKRPRAIAAEIREKVFKSLAVSQSPGITPELRVIDARLLPLCYDSRCVLSLSSNFGGIKTVFGRKVRFVLIRANNNSDASSPILHVR